ncbi:hypothetical protein J5N97_030145 [Dioscorea zingiberensis]|uniref:Uncharacterized protein n=1 Tax=Dioscorea zingiberensis TaxID=325984 RepID=A0A9D5BWK0_9LILI|nr:hypothetical protein J5N97_030145 [Dioscorea zingiberensis]
MPVSVEVAPGTRTQSPSVPGGSGSETTPVGDFGREGGGDGGPMSLHPMRRNSAMMLTRTMMTLSRHVKYLNLQEGSSSDSGMTAANVDEQHLLASAWDPIGSMDHKLDGMPKELI